MSNGEVITLHQGSTATAVIPVIGIDAEGYWTVDYKDGKGFVRIEVDGKPVKAAAADGVTPKFRIDADSCWEISYDGGKSWELDALDPRVLDDLIDKSIQEHLDKGLYLERERSEKSERDRLLEFARNWED